MCQVIHVVLILINIFSRITAFQHKRAFFVFRCMFCFELVTMIRTKYHSRISDVSNYSTIKFYVRIRSTDENIQDCLLLNVISDVTQSIVLQFVKYKIFCFSVVFSPSLKLNISRTGWPISMILISF